MSNLILITSIINTSNNPLSYTSKRSVFSYMERFHQTLNTINSIKNYIPNYKIFLIEASLLNDSEEKLLKNEVDYYLNLVNDEDVKIRVNSISKSMGEGTQTIKALEFIIKNNIIFDNLFKISGRYNLNDNFNYNLFDNKSIVCKKISDNNCNTVFYKIHYNNILKFYNDLNNSEKNFINCEGYESIIFTIINKYEKRFIEYLGVEGYVSVCGTFFQG